MSGDQAEAVAAETPNPRGRPSTYDAEMADRICDLIIEGMSLRDIEDVEGMPSKTTILRWVAKHSEFRDQYARACEARTNAHADEILAIADDGRNDWMDKNGTLIENGEAIRRSQIRIDARKWLMSKLAPKKYGDKVTQEHSGVDGEPINVIARIERILVK